MVTVVNETHLLPTYGTDPTVIDGVACSFAAGVWARADYLMPETLSVQQVHVSFVGWKVGDYGRLTVIHPVNANGYSNPTADVDQGATVIPVPADFAAYALGAPGVAVEFWSADDAVLVEIRGIASSNGVDAITLAEGTGHAHATGARLRLVVSCFAPVGSGGADHVLSGFRAVGSGQIMFGSESEATDPLPGGLLLGHRFHATEDAGVREVAVSYRFRRRAS